MGIIEHYMNLPFDLSGSRAKNRFRNELLWGLKKMLELYQQDDDFTMVFDYSCDIEVHKEETLEFYQLKTQISATSYTVDKLLKLNKSGESIFGKLYVLKYDKENNENHDIKLAVVCNAPLNDGKKIYSNTEIVDLSSIDTNAVNKIKKKTRSELNLLTEIKLHNTSYEKTSMDLIYPDKTLIGELVLFYQYMFKSEPKKVHALFNLLKDEIERKASYELMEEEYDKILEKKGINKSYIGYFLNSYKDTAEVALEKAKKFIEEHYKDDYYKKIDLLRSISQVMSQLSQHNSHLEILESKIKECFEDKNIIKLHPTEFEITELILEKVLPYKTIEITDEEIHALVILVLKKIEEGV